jgi:hypothetical protein
LSRKIDAACKTIFVSVPAIVRQCSPNSGEMNSFRVGEHGMLRMPWVKCRISFGSRWCEGFLPGCYSRRRSLWPSSPKTLRRLCPKCARADPARSHSIPLQPRSRFNPDAGSPYVSTGYGTERRTLESCGPKGPCGFDCSPSLRFGSLVRRRSGPGDFGSGFRSKHSGCLRHFPAPGPARYRAEASFSTPNKAPFPWTPSSRSSSG